jgi:hypothetical protein
MKELAKIANVAASAIRLPEGKNTVARIVENAP